MKISVVIPVYNEEKAVGHVIEDIKRALDKTSLRYEVIIVNDGSTDGSRKILERTKKIRVINHPYNLGYGAALKTGIKHASGDFILIVDSDMSYPVDEIPSLLKHIDEYDMVVGARRKTYDNIFRRIAKFILIILARIVCGRNVPDLNSGMRVFNKEIALKFINIYPSGFSFTTTITFAFLINNYTIKYVPIDYNKRVGKSTIHPIKDFINFATLIIRVMVYFRPFRVFFLVSMLLFLLGIFFFLYSFLILNKVMDITVIVILLSSVQVFLFGLIADLIVKK